MTGLQEMVTPAVGSRPHPLVGYSGSQRVFFIFRPLYKVLVTSSAAHQAGFPSVITQGTLQSVIMILHASETQLQHANWISI